LFIEKVRQGGLRVILKVRFRRTIQDITSFSESCLIPLVIYTISKTIYSNVLSRYGAISR